MDRRPELRRSMTLAEQLATPDPAIREFLRIPDDYHDAGHRPDAGRGWKPLRDRLRLRRAANAWTATPSQKPGALKSGGGSTRSSNKYIYAPGEATAAFSRTASLRQTQAPTFSRAASTRGGPTVGRAERAVSAVVVDDHDDDEDDDDEEEEEEGGKDEAPPAQMSLMSLLDSWDEDEDEEDEAGGGGGKNAKHQADDDEDEEAEGREEEMVHVCCVCMVRHKGAPFTPCGHTFCRLCSRELVISRGNCPLCHGFIQEILDIF